MRGSNAWLATTFLAISLMAGCGGTTQLAANTNNARPTSDTVGVELSALRVTLPNGIVIALDAGGLITVDGETFGTLQADGRIAAPDGSTRSALLADGQISFGGEIAPVRIRGDQLTSEEGERGTIAIAAPDRLQDRRGDGTVAADVPVIGLTATNHATLLFVVTSVALAQLSDEGDEEPVGVGDDEGEDEAAATPLLRVPVQGAPQRGPPDALVTIVVFSDFQCPFCSRVVPTLEQVLERYGSDVRLVFRHNPLPFHTNAMGAAEAAMEAFAQRGPVAFWQMHDLLFENQTALETASLELYAQQLGLDITRYRLAMANHTHQAAIQADMALSARVGARGTPTFFINGRSFVGAQPFEAFVREVDRARADARARLARGTPRARLYETILAEGSADAPTPEARQPSPPEPEEDPNRRWAIGDGASSPVRGPRSAPVTIQVFSDFQCPFCSRVVPTMERVLQTYGSRVRLVFRHYPLPFHPWAQEAAELAIEIRRQRGDAGFWQFHDLVFANQRTVMDAATSRAGLLALARQVRGVNIAQCERALDQHTHAAAVQADMDAVRNAGAQIATPSFFINGRLVQGAQPFESFERVIDEELGGRQP